MSENPRPGEEERKPSILELRRQINETHALQKAGGGSSRTVEEMKLVGNRELCIKVEGIWHVLTVSATVSIPPQQIHIPKGMAGGTLTIPSSTTLAKVSYYFAPVGARQY